MAHGPKGRKKEFYREKSKEFKDLLKENERLMKEATKKDE